MNKPTPTDKPELAPGAPPMPKGMTPAARKEWKRIVPILVGMRVVTMADTVAVQLYCEAYASYQQACKVLATEGLYYKTEKGMLRPHPAIAAKNQAVREMKAFITELGLSPAARTRVQAQSTPDPADPAAKFFHQ